MQKKHYVYELLANNLISRERFTQLKNQEDASKELPFFFYLFAGLGVTFFLAGLIFFIAANWIVIPKAVKLLGLEFLLFLFVWLAYRFKEKDLWFHLCVVSASVLVGVNLAAIGQIYQTGADSFWLFGLWALLITPWAWFLRLPHLFGFWSLLLFLTLFLFWYQYITPFHVISFHAYSLLLILISNLLFGLALYKDSFAIFSTQVNIYGFQLMAFISVLIPLVEVIFEKHVNGDSFYLLFLAQVIVLLAHFYKQKSLGHMGLTMLYALIVIELILARTIIDDLSSFFVFGVITIVFATLLAQMIKKLYNDFNEDAHA